MTTESLPVFARNGTILPLDTAGGGLTLHYFPKLGAEFFLVEEDAWTQAHAAPAADVLRARDRIEEDAGLPGGWRTTSSARCRWGSKGQRFARRRRGIGRGRMTRTRSLEVRVRVAKDEISIVNVTFE